MNRKTLPIILTITGSICILYGCREQEAMPVVKKPGHTFSVNGSVREITIVPETTEFPDHEGKAEFTSYCAMCHSLRYISEQPDLSPSIWEAEVEKMVVKYKAPIDSATCKKITSYLVAIKGRP